MKTHATPAADDTHEQLKTYARTNSDGQPELVLYNPGETDEWINATSSSAVELEDYR